MNTKYPGYEDPGVTVDVLIFSINDKDLEVLLVKRAQEPFKNKWAIPGGFIKSGESLDEAVKRILKEKTGISEVYSEQLYTFGEPKRDPRSRVITVAYYALVPRFALKNIKTLKVSDLEWFGVLDLPALAFDHKEVLNYGLARLRAKAGYSNIAHNLLPEKFRLSDMQKIYEVILGKLLDKRNFRKRMFLLDLLEDTGERSSGGAHRPARLYRFKSKELMFFD